MIIRWVIGVALLFGILLATLPKTDEASRAKIASASMLMCTKDFRGRVARQLVRGEPVDTAFTNTCPDLVASLTVGEGGEMAIAGNKYPLTMSLTPVLADGSVRWSCRGMPAESIAKLCKP
jgi:hypothetical protein